MKFLSDEIQIPDPIRHDKIARILKDHQIDHRLLQYEKGEFLAVPEKENRHLQIVVKGLVHIYNILEDGSTYSLVQQAGPMVIGDIEFFRPSENPFFVQAETETTCITIDMLYARKHLSDCIPFLHFLAEGMADKFADLVNDNYFTRLTLQERVLNHMKYHCKDHVLKGLEKTSSLLHCSSRQLQRILNQLEQEGKVSKRSKGTYQLESG